MPQIDKKDFHWFLGVKFAVVVYFFYHFKWWVALPMILAVAISYRHPIAWARGLHVMDIGDCNTFVTNPKAPTNIISLTPVSVGRPDYAVEAFRRIVVAHLKARSCIVKVLGDMYYKELDIEEVLAS